MVIILEIDTGAGTAKITVTHNEVLDIVNSLNILCAQKEEEIVKYNEGEDEIAQLRRYEACREGMQSVKTALES